MLTNRVARLSRKTGIDFKFHDFKLTHATGMLEAVCHQGILLGGRLGGK